VERVSGELFCGPAAFPWHPGRAGRRHSVPVFPVSNVNVDKINVYNVPSDPGFPVFNYW
jgi:hypothetical protein